MQDDQEHDDFECPLAAVDRRLGDLHRQWHLAESAYFNPDAFRVAIQTAIQTARTVTFILQSNKKLFDDFNGWYEPWQEKMRANPLLAWMVEARNQIEKRGDLETNSFVRTSILASYFENGPSREVPEALFKDTEQIFETLPTGALADHIAKDGVLRIERRWVENTLPEFELLDAVAITYGHLSSLIDDAHEVLGLPRPTVKDENTGQEYDHESMDGRLPCMIGHSDSRSLDIWLATGEPLKFDRTIHEVPVDEASSVFEKYEIPLENVFGNGDNVLETAKSLFEAARTMFVHDGGHITVVFLLRGTDVVDIAQWAPEEHGHKYVMARALAHDVKRLGADAVIMIGETWMAKADPENPFLRAADAIDRIEALSATLVTKEGEPLRLIAKIERTQNTVKLGETNVSQGGAHYLFAPVYEVWGRKIPADWNY